MDVRESSTEESAVIVTSVVLPRVRLAPLSSPLIATVDLCYRLIDVKLMPSNAIGAAYSTSAAAATHSISLV